MDSIKKLTDLFSQFPTIGRRTASRFVFYLLSLSKEKTNELIQAIQELKNKIKLCPFCFNPYENGSNLCDICGNTARNTQLLCVVEKETDLISIEKTKRYKGLYFILASNISYLKRENFDNLKIKELKERIENPQKFGMPNANFTEIIVALNPTPEGKTISILIEKELREMAQTLNFKITHLAQGLPVGGELEYADEETLESAFEGRK